MRACDDDPEGREHGIPTYPWRQVPRGYATKRQLAALGLRPGSRQPVMQALCRGGRRVAFFYAISDALPKRVPTLAQEEALDRAMAARQTCPHCRVRYPYCLPLRTVGSCAPCADSGGLAQAA
ncbi:RRQRL motif-containing zinc-binding protein [Streptomyces xiamenensis]|uniref:RRQRL motif-containing zinc-binding protein n=1 Tax=Streptomyces xiamenensis TaxID=408015 RepID=UPI0035E122C2